MIDGRAPSGRAGRGRGARARPTVNQFGARPDRWAAALGPRTGPGAPPGGRRAPIVNTLAAISQGGGRCRGHTRRLGAPDNNNTDINNVINGNKVAPRHVSRGRRRPPPRLGRQGHSRPGGRPVARGQPCRGNKIKTRARQIIIGSPASIGRAMEIRSLSRARPLDWPSASPSAGQRARQVCRAPPDHRGISAHFYGLERARRRRPNWVWPNKRSRCRARTRPRGAELVNGPSWCSLAPY